MKTFRYIYLAIFAILLSACQAEIWEPVSDNIKNNSKSAIISLSADKLVQVDPITRAVDVDPVLSKIVDLNIRLSMKDGSFKYIYCSKGQLKIFGRVAQDSDASNYITGHKLNDFNLSNDIQIHLEDLKAGDVSKVEAIANAENELSTANDWSSLQESGPIDLQKGTCMMYGVTEISSSNTLEGHNNCKLFSVQLKRSRAMVSIKLIDTGLYKGVKITPMKVRLANIPNSCTISDLAVHKGDKFFKGNKITTQTESKFEERVVEAGFLEGKVDIATWKPLPENQQQSLGKHNLDMSQMEMKYFFFPFENMQGDNKQPNAGESHITKFPKEVTDAAKTQSITNIVAAKDANINYKSTYIELLCDYQYREASEVKIGGQIIYRFYLGSNEYDNFDVEGNHYYRVNLNLKKFGGAKEDGKTDADGNLIVNKTDASWRVDMNTNEWGFQQDQYDFDGHYIDGEAKVVGNNWKFDKVIAGDGNSSWLTINIVNKNDGMGDYVNPTTATGDYALNIVNGKLRFNLQPMVYMKNGQLDPAGQYDETTYNKPVNYREMKIQVRNLDNDNTEVVTVRQYAPIPVVSGGHTYFMERFEEYPDSQSGVQKGYQWGWENNPLNKLIDYNSNRATFTFGNNMTPGQLAHNSLGLSSKLDPYGTVLVPKAKDCAADVCNVKGQGGILQGASVGGYVLPTADIFKDCIMKSAQYDTSWGPFEPIHIYEQYWTISVLNGSTDAQYYRGIPSENDWFGTANRSQYKRIRAVYNNQPQFYPTPNDPSD